MKYDIWFERRPSIYEYTREGVARIDWVHVPLNLGNGHKPRTHLIVDRVNSLAAEGLVVFEVPGDLRYGLESALGLVVVVGGAMLWDCVETRADLLRQFAARVIIDEALSLGDN